MSTRTRSTRETGAAGRESARPAVSVLVPTCGRPEALARCLEATLASARAYGATFEIRTIHAPGDAASIAAVRARFPEVIVQEADERNLARQRNLAAREARGDILVFLDDDAWPKEGWLAALLAPFADPHVTAAGGCVRSPDGTPQVTVMEVNGLGRQLAGRAGEPPRRGFRRTVAGGNFAVRRAALLELGGYDETYRYHFDDTDLCWRLQRAGGTLAYAPDAEVFHEQAAGPFRRTRYDRDWATIVSNSIYFASRHGGRNRLVDVVLAVLMQLPKTARALAWCAGGRLGARGLGRFLAGQARGVARGIAKARRARPLLPFAARRAPDVAATLAVIVNYRCADQTLACVASLRRTAPGIRVLVVENDSGDGSADVLRAALRDDELFVSDTNRGFGGGCNVGFEAAAADATVRHALLVNPDAEADPGMVQALLGTASRHPEAGIVGGRVVGIDGSGVQYEAGRYAWWSLSRLHARAPAEEFETGFVTGALMLVDAGLLRAGLRFDESFFLYVEDLDLCREVVERGRTLRVNTRARLRHREGGTQPADAVLGSLRPLQLRCMTRGKVYFARKRLGPLRRAVTLFTLVVAKPLAGVLRYRSVAFLPLYFRAVAEGFRLPLRRRP